MNQIRDINKYYHKHKQSYKGVGTIRILQICPFPKLKRAKILNKPGFICLSAYLMYLRRV